MRHAFVEIMRFEERMVPLVDLPAPTRNARFDTLNQEIADSWNPLVRMAVPDLGKFATRVDQQRTQLDLLLALALVEVHHAENGTWPSALPPLYPEREVLLPTAVRLQPGEAGALLLAPEEAALQRLTSGLAQDTRPEALTLMATP